MFCNALAILEKIKADLTGPVTALVPDITLNLDEPITLVYSDLPSLSAYPVKEDFIRDESYSFDDKKRLSMRIELRMKGGPSSTVCTPVVNAICSAIKADPVLAGLAEYVEIQSIQWANDVTEKGQVCGAAVDVQVDYMTS